MDRPRRLATANGVLTVKYQVNVMIESLGLVVSAIVMPNSPSVLSLGRLVAEHGYAFEWGESEAPILSHKSGLKIPLQVDNLVPMLSQTPSQNYGPIGVYALAAYGQKSATPSPVTPPTPP